jgi:uncharacterized protein (DUF427 family)
VHPSKLQKNELRTESEPGLAVLEEEAVGLSWQQGPLSAGAIGRFLVPEPLPKSLLYVEPLRRRFRVRFGGAWIADSEHALVLFEPGRYPVAYFRESDISSGVLERTEHTTEHPDLGVTSWFTVHTGDYSVPRGAWQHVELPAHAQELQTRVAFACRQSTIHVDILRSNCRNQQKERLLQEVRGLARGGGVGLESTA